MFRHRQQQRRWAARVLFLWLFGLAAGIANACLGPDPAPDSAGRAGIRIAATVSWHEAAPHPHADDGARSLPVHDRPATAPAQANCEDFCDQASVSVPALKSAPGALADAALLSTGGPTALPQPGATPLAPWVPSRDGWQPPPIPIVFLRLAL